MSLRGGTVGMPSNANSSVGISSKTSACTPRRARVASGHRRPRRAARPTGRDSPQPRQGRVQAPPRAARLRAKRLRARLFVRRNLLIGVAVPGALAGAVAAGRRGRDHALLHGVGHAARTGRESASDCQGVTPGAEAAASGAHPATRAGRSERASSRRPTRCTRALLPNSTRALEARRLRGAAHGRAARSSDRITWVR